MPPFLLMIKLLICGYYRRPFWFVAETVKPGPKLLQGKMCNRSGLGAAI